MYHSKTLKVTAPTLGLININFFDISYKMLELYKVTDEITRQKGIKHLGLISNVFDNVSHSRWDYLMLQCGITELVKRVHVGSSYFSLGSIKINGKTFDGEALIKTWLMFSNFGHTKNTLGDEKTLSLILLKNTSLRSFILNKIKDKELKEFSKSIINNYKYTELHLVLGILRIYLNLNAGYLRDEILVVIKAFLLEDFHLQNKVDINKMEQLKLVHKTIRELSIVAIDSHYSHLPIKIDIMSAILNLNDRKNEDKDNPLTPILEFLNTELYLNKNVLCIQAQYSMELTKIIGSKKISYDKLFNELIFDENIIENNFNNYIPFTTLTLKPYMQNSNNLSEIVKTIDDNFSVLEDILFDVDKNPINNDIYINFFIKNNISNSAFQKLVFNVSKYIDSLYFNMIEANDKDSLEIYAIINYLEEQLSSQNIKLDKISSKILDKVLNNSVEYYFVEIRNMFEQFFKDIVRHFFKENFTIQILDNSSKYKNFVYSNSEQQKYLKSDLIDAILKEAEVKDFNRIHEIEQLHKSVSKKFDGYTLLLISRTKIFDLTKPPNQRLQTDIDSAVIKISEHELIVEFNEAKNVKRNREKVAAKDLRDKFITVLNSNAKGYRIVPVKDYGSKLRIKYES